jgi:hypothetical protein
MQGKKQEKPANQMSEATLTVSQSVLNSLSSQFIGELRQSSPLELVVQDTIPFDSLDIAYQFRALTDRWHHERGASSSTDAIVNCMSYRRIVYLGERVLPYIFNDLQTKSEPDYWFTALREITGANPVHPHDRGKHRAMASAWIKWGRTHGYAR